MPLTLTLRTATPADIAGVDALLQRSYPRLLAADYPPSIRVLALPLITRAQPELLQSGRYYVVQDTEGSILGAGGYSYAAPTPAGAGGALVGGVGHIRHFVTDPEFTRRGIASSIMRHIIARAAAERLDVLDCFSTRTAVPFYTAMGFVREPGEVEVALQPGIAFPAVRMRWMA